MIWEKPRNNAKSPTQNKIRPQHQHPESEQGQPDRQPHHPYQRIRGGSLPLAAGLRLQLGQPGPLAAAAVHVIGDDLGQVVV
jgi:hypothetical protein